MSDVRIENHGSVTLLRPMSDAGKEWLKESLQVEGWQHFGGAIAAEPRMVEPVYEGMIADGLEVEIT